MAIPLVELKRQLFGWAITLIYHPRFGQLAAQGNGFSARLIPLLLKFDNPLKDLQLHICTHNFTSPS